MGVRVVLVVGDDTSATFIGLEVSIAFAYLTGLSNMDSGNRAGAAVVVVLSNGACSNECWWVGSDANVEIFFAKLPLPFFF